MEIRDDELMVAFVEAMETSGSSTTALEWMKRYPSHARQFAQFASEYRATTFRPLGESSFSAPISAARIQQIGLEAVRAKRAAMAQSSNVPMRSLLAAAGEKGLDGAGAAAVLEVPFGVFVKLHRRLIAPTSIPAAFLQKLSDTIGRSIDEVTTYLRQPPTLAAGASYRADDTPTVGNQESFADALRSDPEATGAQQTQWL